MRRSQLRRDPGRRKSMCKGPVVGKAFTCASSVTEAREVEQREEKTQRWLKADLRV